MLKIDNSAGPETDRFPSDTAVHHPIESFFSYLSPIWITTDSSRYLATSSGLRRLLGPCRAHTIHFLEHFYEKLHQVLYPSLHYSPSATWSACYLYTAVVWSINQVMVATAPCLTLTSAPSEVIMKTHFITGRQEYE